MHQKSILCRIYNYMENELEKVFIKAKYEEKSNLADNIWDNIVRRNKRIINIKLWSFSFIGFFSFLGLIPAYKTLSSDLAQSGFYEYLSLVFSSNNSIFSYWKELVLSIAESLPTMSIVLSFSLIFILFLSLRYVTKQIMNPARFVGHSGGGQLLSI